MRVRRAVTTVALTLFAAGVLSVPPAFAVTAEHAASTAVLADNPDEMGYNGVSPDEMGYN
ncbi:hypothetical protein [Amycolatopsis sp. NPDC051102]|uniref:hypothetical protein n=1 Tax=Amycolatopsis sp. NPDC051102 TaxID=3155163 RepID=UPI003424F538